jgi:phenylalanyl-tRNA synthetase beta chain
MKFAVSMLRDHVDTRLTAEEIGDLLTMAGFELEGIEEVEGEPVLDIKVVSNRGDGLSVVGLTREILAKDPESRPTDLYVRATRRFEDVSLTGENPAAIKIESSHCNRFALMSVSKIQNGEANTTIRRRLEQAGMRSISLLVDLTNYVMLELGQPLHAFDVDKLGLHVVVRQAQAGEKLVTLNGVENELQSNQLVIATPDRSVGVAGVMGGLDTEVSSSTNHALIESAHFLNTSVRKTRKQLGLNTEASYRFERSVDPDGVTAALRRFAELLSEHQPEAVISTILDDYPRPPKEIEIDLDLERANRLLGLQIPAASAVRYLTSLGFRVAGHGDPFLVVPPSWRTDIKREEDLVEELGRVHGYELIPEMLPEGQTVPGGVNGAFYLLDRITDRLLALGYHQALSHSLRGVHALDAVGERVGPRNPGSPDTAFLRNSLIPGLSDAAQRNGSKDQFWFEIGKVFTPEEARSVAILASGALLPPGVNEKAETPADFYAVKAAVEDILAAIGVSTEFQPTDQDARLHPFRQAAIGEFGVIGEVHPALATELGLADRTVVVELNLERLLQQDSPELKVKSFSRHPAVRRDVAVLVNQSVPFAELESAIRSAAGPVLERLWVFDDFRGPGIPEDSHSVGIGMIFRKPDSTFTDEEANQVRDEIAAALQSVGATLR